MPVRKASRKLRLARWWHSKVWVYFLWDKKQVYSLLLSNFGLGVCLHGSYTSWEHYLHCLELPSLSWQCFVLFLPLQQGILPLLASCHYPWILGKKPLILGTVVTVPFLFLWRLASSHLVCDWWEASGKTSQGLASAGPGCQRRDCLYRGDPE